jgi:hypothetical protein
MLELAREAVPQAEVRQLVLPDDPLPECDAVVSVGHVLSYLPAEPSIERALVAAARALRADGVLAIDLLDFIYGDDLRPDETRARMGEGWAVITRVSRPRPDLYLREIAAFLRNDDGSWRRDDERHENVLTDVAHVPDLLAKHGVGAEARDSFAGEELPRGLFAIVGSREG